jgi:hypothetical protein
MGRSSEFEAGRGEHMPLHELLSSHTAGDSSFWRTEGSRNEPVPWDKVFNEMTAERIERNSDEGREYWHQFHEHIRTHGIQNPIVLHEGKVTSGHHRLWAAHNIGLQSVPVVHATSPEHEQELWAQQSDEEDWRRR